MKKELRVLGTKLIVGGLDLEGNFCLFLIGPSGTIHEANLHAIGSRGESFISEVLPDYNQEIMIKDAIPLAMKAILGDNGNPDRLFIDILTLTEKKFVELTLDEKLNYVK